MTEPTRKNGATGCSTGLAAVIIGAFLVAALWFGVPTLISDTGKKPSPTAGPPDATTPDATVDAGVPTQGQLHYGVWGDNPEASWPQRCLIEDVGVHQAAPLFAIGCNDPFDDDAGGTVLVIDAQTGKFLTGTHLPNQYVGFEGGGNLKFDRSGKILATNSGTSGIATIDHQGKFIGQVFPDEGRDHAVRYVWVDHRMYTDTGNFFEIKPDDYRFDFEPGKPPWFVQPIWNASAELLVGTERLSHSVPLPKGNSTIRWTSDLVAYDPIKSESGYRVELEPRDSRTEWSPDGRRVAVWKWEKSTDISVRIFNGDDASEITEVPLGHDIQIDVGPWGPDEQLLVQTSKWLPDVREWEKHLVLVHKGSVAWTVPIPARLGPTHYSPNGERFAYFASGAIRVRKSETGMTTASFRAAAPPVPPGLPDWYGSSGLGKLAWVSDDRIAQYDGHFVRFWTPNGELKSEFLLPMNSP